MLRSFAARRPSTSCSGEYGLRDCRQTNLRQRCAQRLNAAYICNKIPSGLLNGRYGSGKVNAISELIGTGRATELQMALENSRRAWSRATNQLTSEITDTEERLSRLNSQLRELTGSVPTGALSGDEWTNWWARAQRLGVTADSVPGVESSRRATRH